MSRPVDLPVRFRQLLRLRRRADPLFDPLGALNFDTYLLLEKGADPRPVGPKLTEIAAANNCPQVKNGASFRLRPLSALHLDARPNPKDTEILGDRRLVQLFSVIAAAILLIACVNFMNLSTARAAVPGERGRRP